MSFGGATVRPSKSVRNLGIYIDSALSMREHVIKTVSRCFGALRQLRTVRQHVPTAVFQSLVTTLVLSRLDYGNVVLAGASKDLLRRLQSVQNAAARLVFSLRRRDHVSDALLQLHWLKVPERIKYKLLTLTFRALHGTAPHYLNLFERVAENSGRLGLRSAVTHHLVIPPSRLVSVGGRSFPVVAASAWNCLPSDIVDTVSTDVFRARLKTFLFRQSYPNISF